MAPPLRYVVLDFDGTCTKVEQIWQPFLASYLDELRAANDGAPSEADWIDALRTVARESPRAGWTLDWAPSTAPAAADPYIQAGEAAALLARGTPGLALPPAAFVHAYRSHPAPWRDDAIELLDALVGRGLRVGFISNSDKAKVQQRVDELLVGRPALRDAIFVQGNARKYVIHELALAATPSPHAACFAHTPAIHADASAAIGRPVYLRRGRYFEALCAFWHHHGAAGTPISETLVIGDVWELDLAMPQALGAQVHLIRRAEPYPSYDYELAQVAAAHQSDDLRGVLTRL